MIPIDRPWKTQHNVIINYVHRFQGTNDSTQGIPNRVFIIQLTWKAFVMKLFDVSSHFRPIILSRHVE